MRCLLHQMRGSFRSFEETSELKSRDSAFNRFTMQQQTGPRKGLVWVICGSSAAVLYGKAGPRGARLSAKQEKI
jgi:hypothetical protein